MAIYVKLQEDELEGHNVSSSFWHKILDISETKKISIFLTFILLVNTVVIIIIANNRISNKVNEFSIKNESYFYEYKSSNLSYDYPPDISDDQPLIELDDATKETSHINDEQSHYTSSESVDEAPSIPDENNQAQTNY